MAGRSIGRFSSFRPASRTAIRRFNEECRVRATQRAEELFKRDYPSGSFARRLPQFRSSYPDPVGDYYRRLAEKELSNQ